MTATGYLSSALITRINSEAGTIDDNRLPVGTTAGTVAAGDDSRLSTSGLLVTQQAGANDLAKLQAAVTAAATLGAWAIINSELTVSGTVTVPSGARIDGSQGSITQQANLTPTFLLTDATDVVFRRVKAVGKGSDYVNSSAVLPAACVYASGTSSKVRVEFCDFSNHAGAGVRIGGSASDVRVVLSRLAGPGPAYITPQTNNYGMGVTAADGATQWSVNGCQITGYAQGVNSGNVSNVRIVNNDIYDITGQHGIYLDAANSLVISGNIIRATGLQGIKVQIANTTTGPDADQISITGNVVTSSGSHCILLTKVVSGSRALRRITVTGNTLYADGNGGDGINLVEVANATVESNTIHNARNGISTTTCAGLSVVGNRVYNCQQNGVLLTDTDDVNLLANRIVDPASSNSSTAEFGIHVTGTSSNIWVDGNRVSDSAGNMRYGLYFSTSSQATCVARNNDLTGATDYGARLDNTQSIKEWANNVCSGTLGSVLNFPSTLVIKGPPTEYTGTAAPTSGTWVRGDIVWNRTPNSAGVLGWVCVASGTPGTWKPFGERQSLWSGPASNNLLGATFDPLFNNAGAGTTTAGVLLLAKVHLPRGGSISSVDYALTGAGSGLTSGQNLIGVWSSAGTLLGTSVDQTTNFESTGQKSAALVASTATQDIGANVYVGLLWNGSGSPQLRGVTSTASFANVATTSADYRFATAGSSLTALPDPLPAMSSGVQAPWFGVR